jgi:hypothetical protein
MTPLLGLAGSDCERLGSGVFAQPANTLSSAAYLLAGAWIVWRGLRATGHRAELQVFGLVVASNAVGGLLFHGVQTVGARWAHDACLLAVMAFIVVFDIGRLRERSTRWTMRVFAASLVAIGLLTLWAGAMYALATLLGIAAGAFELAEYRHEIPTLRAEGLSARRLARLGALAALALGGTAFWIGRSGAPFCDPSSAFQWHAVWHVSMAAAMALYAYAAIEPHPASTRV